MKLRITIFGLTVTSSWGNGHATTFRSLCSALKKRGHEIVFFEKDAEWYASNRDLLRPGFASIQLYTSWDDVVLSIRNRLRDSDVVLVGSYAPDGIAALQEAIDADVPVIAFYDIDTPVTLAALHERGATHYLDGRLIKELDLYFTFTGGPALRDLEQTFGAKRAVPLYCSVDPEIYHRCAVDPKLRCALSYMGTYARSRQPKIDELLSSPARARLDFRFIVAGPQYPPSVRWPGNVERILHLEPKYHPSLYSSSDFVLNVTRREMVIAGYSPSVRLFEAAACGATIISDEWPGIDGFFVPQEEILLASHSDDVLHWLRQGADPAFGKRARERVLAEHTGAVRAREFEAAVLEYTPLFAATA